MTHIPKIYDFSTPSVFSLHDADPQPGLILDATGSVLEGNLASHHLCQNANLTSLFHLLPVNYAGVALLVVGLGLAQLDRAGWGERGRGCGRRDRRVGGCGRRRWSCCRRDRFNDLSAGGNLRGSGWDSRGPWRLRLRGSPARSQSHGDNKE